MRGDEKIAAVLIDASDRASERSPARPAITLCVLPLCDPLVGVLGEESGTGSQGSVSSHSERMKVWL